MERGVRVSEIKGLKEPQGVIYDAERNQLYVATGGDGKVRIYNGKSLGLESTLDFGDDAGEGYRLTGIVLGTEGMMRPNRYGEQSHDGEAQRRPAAAHRG